MKISKKSIECGIDLSERECECVYERESEKGRKCACVRVIV